jgi:hypothetical protein
LLTNSLLTSIYMFNLSGARHLLAYFKVL